MIKEKYKINDTDYKLLKKTFWRSLSLSASGNFENMQALAYIWAMIPFINHYNQDKEKRKAAYKRHFRLFNTTPSVGTFITGLTAAMEKKAAQDENFDTESINAVKVSLMGPFAGVGDSIFWGSLRIITLGIGISLAMQGSILGAVLHVVLYNLVAHFVRYYGTFIGFGMGSEFLQKAQQSGIMGAVTKGAGIVGLMTVGAMTCTMINCKIPLVLNIQGSELAIQSIFDQIFPNMLPLLLAFGCYKLLKKGVNANWIILALFVLSIGGKAVGLF